MRRCLRDPLAGFAAAAGGVFLLFAALGKEASDPARIVEITRADIDHLKESFQVVWLRPPNEDELRELIDERVRDEIFYREALAMGLDRDDAVVRRRMRQSLEMMASEPGSATEPTDPTDEDLETYLRQNPDRYRTESILSFQQIYFNSEKRGAGSAASKLLEELRTKGDSLSASELGDRTLLPAGRVDARISEVAAQFGRDFSEALSRSPEGEWVGPIESPYGIHLVRVDHRVEGGIPSLRDVRDAVLRDFKAARAENAEAEFFASILSRYTIDVEPEEPGSR